MLIDSSVKKLFSELVHTKHVELSIMGSVITASLVGNELRVSSPVYWGGNYIPPSVRECLKKRLPFDQTSIRTFLTISEGKFEIALNFKEDMSLIDKNRLVLILEEFGYLANEWREWLDNHDKKDLVYSRAR